MSEVKCMPTCEDGEERAILNMIHLIERAHRDLVLLGLESEITLERICDFQFMYIIWFLVVYLTYFKKPVKETTFSSKIHKTFFANIRNDCIFSVIKNKQHSYAIRVWGLSS